MEYLHDLLRKHYQSIQSLHGDQVELICHQEALSKIQAEAPTSKIKWALNGVEISQDRTRVIMKNNSNLGNACMLSVTCTCVIHSRNSIFMRIFEQMCNITDLASVTPQSHFTFIQQKEKSLLLSKVNFQIQKNWTAELKML
jgi:hypothetical protein